jgi:hypothetical protein
MKKRLLLSFISATLLANCVYASDSDNFEEPKPIEESSKNVYESYNYIGFGIENLTYVEQAPSIESLNIYEDFKSTATITSPVYTSGSLIKATENFDFSIDAASTLTPGTTDEKWQVGDYVKQENKFEAMVSDLKILVHYKLNDNHRFVFGPAYKMFSMKRYDAVAKSTAGDTPLDMALNEERVSTLFANAGYWYENAPFSNNGMRIKASATYGKPISRQAANTSTTQVTFNDTNGFGINCNAYLGFTIIKGLELGVFADYDLSKKEGASEKTIDGEVIYWPDNELETFRYGVSAVWNFSVK